MKLLTISHSIHLKSRTVRPASSGWLATCSASAFSIAAASSSPSWTMTHRHFRSGGATLASMFASMRSIRVLRSCRQGWLHYVFHNVFTDLEARIRADAGREAVMEAGPDTSIRNLIGKGRHVGKAMGHAGCSSACYRDLRNVLSSERRLNDARDGATKDAVCARVFGVHRRVIDRLPSRLAFRDVIAVNIAVTDGSDRSPEVVMVLGVEHSYERVVEADSRERHKPRAVTDTHLFCGYELAYERVIGWWTDHEPEPCSLGLLRRALCTGLAAIVLELVIVSCPFLARQRNRGIWPELGCRRHGERLHVRPRRGCGDGCWHIDAGRGSREPPRPVPQPPRRA